MDKKDLLISLGEQIGHAKILQAAECVLDSGNKDEYLEKFVQENDASGCSGREGECGSCIRNVWYPCV